MANIRFSCVILRLLIQASPGARSNALNCPMLLFGQVSLLEARTKPKDRVAAMIEQRQVFEKMVKNAQAKLAS